MQIFTRPGALQEQRLDPVRVDHLLAYIDVGSGSLIAQVTIASIVAIPFFVRTQIRNRIHSLRARLGRSPSPAADESEAR